MSLKYEPVSEPVHISVRQLFLNPPLSSRVALGMGFRVVVVFAPPVWQEEPQGASPHPITPTSPQPYDHPIFLQLYKSHEPITVEPYNPLNLQPCNPTNPKTL